MFRKFLITLLLIVGSATTGFCSDLVYSLAGHKFMPVQKGNLYLALTSTTADTKDTLIDREIYLQTISLYGAFDLSDKFSVNLDLPYINSQANESSGIKGNGIGDISLGLKYQVTDQEERFADVLFHLTAIVPTGISPYKINPWNELPTGSGGYSLRPEITLSKKTSNSIPFCSLFYQHNLTIDGLSFHLGPYDGESQVYLKKVEPGDEYGISLGLVELLRENMSLMLRLDYHGSMASHFNWFNRDDYKNDPINFSKVTTGFGYKFPSKLSVFTTFSIGVGDEAPNYELGIRVVF